MAPFVKDGMFIPIPDWPPHHDVTRPIGVAHIRIPPAHCCLKVTYCRAVASYAARKLRVAPPLPRRRGRDAGRYLCRTKENIRCRGPRPSPSFCRTYETYKATLTWAKPCKARHKYACTLPHHRRQRMHTTVDVSTVTRSASTLAYLEWNLRA